MEKKPLILDGHKLLWHPERLKAWLNGERIAPITIDCALTRRCNYRCIYCYGQLQENDEKKMTKDVICRFLDDAAEIGVKAISFVSDGESTCSKHIYDAIIHGKDNGLDMALGTNGVLLDIEKLPLILPKLTYLRFNISAATASRYAQVHGCKESDYYKLTDIIKTAVEIKKKQSLEVTLGLQMVLLPSFKDQILPLAILGKDLEVDYTIIKHCSDDENSSLGINYKEYISTEITDLLRKAEDISDDKYLVKAKWSKILSQGKRRYTHCYGPAFIMQLSGSGLVAPCGMLFNTKYNRFHIGNIAETSFKEIWQSKRYWDVLSDLASNKFNPQTDCGTLCLQDRVNEFLWDLKQGNIELKVPTGPKPMHVNFI